MQEQVKKAGHQTIFLLRTMSELRPNALLQERLLAATGWIYGVLALVLAAVGLFGLLTFFIARRKSEIAIRMALGAERRDIGLLVIRETSALLGTGILAGLLFSYAAVRALASLLYGVSPILISPVALSLVALCGVVAAAVLGPFIALPLSIPTSPYERSEFRTLKLHDQGSFCAHRRRGIYISAARALSFLTGCMCASITVRWFCVSTIRT